MQGASRHHDLRGKSWLYKELYYLKLENNKTNFAQLIDLMLGKCGAMWDRVQQDSQHPVNPASGAQVWGTENQESQGPGHCHQAPGWVEETLFGLPLI